MSKKSGDDEMVAPLANTGLKIDQQGFVPLGSDSLGRSPEHARTAVGAFHCYDREKWTNLRTFTPPALCETSGPIPSDPCPAGSSTAFRPWRAG